MPWSKYRPAHTAFQAKAVKDPVDDVEVGVHLPGADIENGQHRGVSRCGGRDGAEVSVQHRWIGAVVTDVQPVVHLQPSP